jgi:type IV pilus assembly protein PilY1
MNIARHSKRLLAALMASAITVVDVHAAITDIYNQPLATTSTIVVKPNIMFILDNSGSMANDYMPDDMSGTGKYGFKSAQCNGVAFDPALTYLAPIKADASFYANANFNLAAPDGYTSIVSRASGSSVTVGTSSKTFNIPTGGNNDYNNGDPVVITSTADATVKMSGSVTGWNASSSKNLVVNVTGTSGSGTFSSWTVSLAADLNNSTYYTYSGAETRMNWTYNSSGNVQNNTPFYLQCQTNVGSATTPANVFTAVTLTNASLAADKQNYANWYSYYRTRRLMTRTATGIAFSTLSSSFRVGFTTISNTSAAPGAEFVDIGDYTASKKAAFYTSLYSATGNSNTPLRGALTKAGRYFANKAPGQTSDPMQYSCQRNYAILSTDGYWNTGAETTSYGPYQVDSNTAVGQQDGAEAKPMHDGASALSTEVTPITTVTRYPTPQTGTDTVPWTRFSFQVDSSTNGGTCTGGTYRVRVRTETRNESVSKSRTSVDDVTTINTHTVVWTDGVITSDTNPITSTSSANVSTSAITYGSPSTFSSWNAGSATQWCRTAAQLTGGLTVGGTSYSSTGCPSGACTYTNISSTANGNQGTTSTGSWTNGTRGTGTIMSGPTAGTTTTTASTSGGSTSSLADVAEYYYKTDLRSSALNNCTGSVDPDGNTHDVCDNTMLLPMPPLDIATHQHMTTYTIGLGVNGTLAYDSNYLNQQSGAYVQLKDGTTNWPVPTATTSGGDARSIDDLWHAAVNGRGRYFATSNANTLSNALQSALSDFSKTFGAAAGAATNSLEPVLGDDNQAYIATYRTVEWSGDIEAHPLNAQTGVITTTTTTWSAQARLEALAAGSRNIKYMRPNKSLAAFNYTNLNTDGHGGDFSGLCSKSPAPLQCATLNAAKVTLANDGDNLVNFLRGDSTYEALTNTTNPLYRERVVKLGDIINASPVYVKKATLKYTDAGYSTFAAGTASRRAMLYAGANDGMLHAFDATTGDEVWAFVPSYVMPNMYRLADTDYGNSHRSFVDGSPVVADIYTGSAWKTILVGGLNSGGKGYYALDITDPNNPVGLWEFTDTNMGLTYGNPVVTKMADGTWVVAVSSGLNNADGVGRLYLINAATGVAVTGGTLSTATGTTADPSGLNKINGWVDDPTNNTAKRFYGGDMFGNLWRFDFNSPLLYGAAVTKLATFQISSTSPQPITTKPQLTVVTASGGTKVPVIVVATGRYLGINDVTDTTVQSIYAIKDPLTATGWGDVRPRTDLVSQTVTVSGITGTGAGGTVDWATNIGWRMDLPQSKERVTTDFLVNFNVLTVASAVPGNSVCRPSGSSWLYEISIGTGKAANGTTVSSYLGAFLVVGMSAIMTTDGNLRQIIVGSDASVQTRKPSPPSFDINKIRRSSWRELIH